MINFTIGSIRETGYLDIAGRCPHCLNGVTFDGIGKDLMTEPRGEHQFGVRRCPNSGCRKVVFFILEKPKRSVTLFPHSRLPFEASGIPPLVASPFAEALICLSHEAYVAAAIMVRKTLEMICHDQNAKGKDLKDRLDALGKSIVIPNTLVEALHELRLLGNDAAHVESREYDQVSLAEVEAGIAVAQEILKATYQYQGLIEKLRALKKVNQQSSTTPPGKT